MRLLLYSWGLVSIILFNAYSSTLTSYLMTPRYHSMIDSMDDIVKMERPVFMVQKSSSHEEAVLVLHHKVKSSCLAQFKKHIDYTSLRVPIPGFF